MFYLIYPGPYLPTCLPTYVPTYLPVYLPTYLPAYTCLHLHLTIRSVNR